MRALVPICLGIAIGCGGSVADDVPDDAGSKSGNGAAGGSGAAGGIAAAGGAGGSSAGAGATANAAGATGASGGGSTLEPGCPISVPSQGQLCADGSYYCFYYDAPTDLCADSWKCSDGGGVPFGFIGAGENCNTPPADQCDVGQPCAAVEPKGACLVACTRKCTCDVATQLLTCEPLAC